MSLLFDNPVQPVLDLPPNPTAWQHSPSGLEVAARWQIYLHQLGASALSSWFQAEFDQPPQLWPEVAPFDIWHVVGGLALTLGDKRIVVMLTESLDAAELRVPQEWVDIPAWGADYYLAAQIDIDQQRLVLWGYTTHALLKTQGLYDANDRTYRLNDGQLVQDFSAFWVAQRLEQVEVVSLEALPSLSPVQADNLSRRLAQVPEPRLEIPFRQWGALLSHANWRQRLYQQRQQGMAPINLGRWANQIFEPGWEALASLLPQTPALGFRSMTADRAVAVRGKPICLGLPTADLVLVLAVALEPDQRRNIRIQLYPSGEALLPRQVALTLELPDTGEPLQTVYAEDQDNCIQLPPFRCPAEQPFRVRVHLGNQTAAEEAIEDFIEDFVS
ncbi:MAG: DUF1822 family protein [Cyanobacteria bacterium P01_F01_bin.4]